MLGKKLVDATFSEKKPENPSDLLATLTEKVDQFKNEDWSKKYEIPKYQLVLDNFDFSATA